MHYVLCCKTVLFYIYTSWTTAFHFHMYNCQGYAQYNSLVQQGNTNKGNKYHNAFDVDRFLKIYNRYYIQSILKEKLTGS